MAMAGVEELNRGVAGFYHESLRVWEDVWGDHIHHGFYDPHVAVPLSIDGHRSALVRMIEEALAFAAIEGWEGHPPLVPEHGLVDAVDTRNYVENMTIPRISSSTTKLFVDYRSTDDGVNRKNAVGEYSDKFNNLCGSIVCQFVPLKVEKGWSAIEPHLKKPLDEKVLDYFQLDLEDEYVVAVIDSQMAKSYRTYRGKIHKHFKNVGGVANIETTKEKKPEYNDMVEMKYENQQSENQITDLQIMEKVLGPRSTYIRDWAKKAKKSYGESSQSNLSKAPVQEGIVVELQAQIFTMTEVLTQVSFQVGDALQQPYPDEQFDLVWSMESGEHMPDKMNLVCRLVGLWSSVLAGSDPLCFNWERSLFAVAKWWKTIKEALVMPLIIKGYKSNLIKSAIITCKKPK
ncbi:hypothetical protein Sjap_002422 [Stephania japonica]|uniref:Methyltransferase type 11 domain-containing protein n=1 Tax=Stephania japonica TaxID=461633 RepID=A0AAP0PSM3_9MAGN